jgi:hypothetical protein
MIKKFTFLVLVFLVGQLYSQTEQDYFEKLRLERKDKKIKTISAYSYFNEVLESKEYYDENGYLVKRETYQTDLLGENLYVYMEIVINNYDNLGNISGNQIMYESDGKKLSEFPFSNLDYTYFFEVGFDESTVIDIKYIFDKNGNVIEKRLFIDGLNENEYEKTLLYYDNMNKLTESKYYGFSTSVNIVNYYYNSIGLLEKEESSYDFQKGGRVYGMRFEYEFF